jgi:hypothetical protein
MNVEIWRTMVISLTTNWLCGKMVGKTAKSGDLNDVFLGHFLFISDFSGAFNIIEFPQMDSDAVKNMEAS